MENKKSTPTTIAQLVASSKTETADAPAVDAKKTHEVSTDKATSDNKESAPESMVKKSPEVKKKKIKILDTLLAKNMLVPGSDIGPEIQDDYRRIKRPLVSNACGRNKSMVDRGNLILVTSSIPGEGKTYTSVNLALSISQEKDNTVLLLDCDVTKQGISRELGLKNTPGLVDVLESDDLTIADVILQTDIPNLRVVSAGRRNEYVAELLASNRMSELVEELASRYSDRIIICDGPPLLPTPQTQILAGLVGQVVFVIEAGKTPQSLVADALEMIPDEQATGIILNKNQGLAVRGYYYGYYGPDDET